MTGRTKVRGVLDSAEPENHGTTVHQHQGPSASRHPGAQAPQDLFSHAPRHLGPQGRFEPRVKRSNAPGSPGALSQGHSGIKRPPDLRDRSSLGFPIQGSAGPSASRHLCSYAHRVECSHGPMTGRTKVRGVLDSAEPENHGTTVHQHQGPSASRHPGAQAPQDLFSHAPRHLGPQGRLNHGSSDPTHQGAQEPCPRGTQGSKFRRSCRPRHHRTEAPRPPGSMPGRSVA